MMFNLLASAWLRWWGGVPAFRVYGRSRRETAWRVVDVYATHRRDMTSRWPAGLFRGTCIAWTAAVISLGNDIATEILREQFDSPASRDHPLEVAGGRLRDLTRRSAVGAEPWPSASEILAHEIGHTAQARRFDFLYLVLGALFTLYREGDRWVNWFENQASADGLFGGLVNGSVHPDFLERVRRPSPPDG